MIRGGRIPGRIFLLLAAAAGFGCILEAVAGPAATAQVIYVTATPGRGGLEGFTPSPTAESILDLTATWTPTPEPTNTAATAPVRMTAGQNLSCVKGPHWILYEWVAGISEGEVVTLLARSTPEWPDYYFARTAGGKECWAFGASSTISGDPSTLPMREAPPLPQITFVIRNNTYLRVEQLSIRGKDETGWGSDRLAETINYRATFSLTFTAGFYDVLIKDHRNGIVYEKYDSPIGPEAGSSVIILEGRYTVRIHSDSAAAMCRVHIQSFDSIYQSDLTIPGDGRISPGEDVMLEGLGGIYDMRFYRCSDGGMGYGISGACIGPSTATHTIY